MKTKIITYFRNILLVITLVLLPMCVNAMRTSVAGFFPLQNSGRVVYNFNEGWLILHFESIMGKQWVYVNGKGAGAIIGGPEFGIQ